MIITLKNNIEGQGRVSKMRNVNFLLTLMRAQIDRLEKLRRLESRFYLVPPGERAAVQRKIDAVMEELATISQAIQAHKATHNMAA